MHEYFYLQILRTFLPGLQSLYQTAAFLTKLEESQASAYYVPFGRIYLAVLMTIHHSKTNTGVFVLYRIQFSDHLLYMHSNSIL